jgi:hypothetical protein
LVWQGGTSSISGKYSSALNLDTAGGNDYAECTDANCGGTSKLDFNANTDFSWGGWVNTQTTGTTQAVIAKKQGTAVNAGYMLHITTSDVPRCTVGDSSANASATGTTDVVDGTWHHVMCIVEGNLIKIYVDGRFEAQTDATSAVDETHDNTDSFRIGLFGNGNNPLTGKVDDIRVYNYAVTDQQILEAMNLGSVNFAPA